MGSMDSLHQAGDSIVAMATMTPEGFMVIGSGVMVGPGLILCATHVLDEFPKEGAGPVCLTFLPGRARAWLSRGRTTLTGPSDFDPNRSRVSDLTLMSCSLNSEAHEDFPLMLAPIKLALPLIGERLWAFGYRHGDIVVGTSSLTPCVTSGLVTACFPQGRGERMPATCIEVAMDSIGGMSGGSVVNDDGWLVGIISSSFEGGPTYVTLLWDALRLSVSGAPQSVWPEGDVNLFMGRELGLVFIKGDGTLDEKGNVTITLSTPEMEQLAKFSDPIHVTRRDALSCTRKFLDDAQLESFEEKWSREMEEAASAAALEHLGRLTLPSVCEFLAAADIHANCLTSIRHFSVEDFEGLEDPAVISVEEREGTTLTVSYSFDLLSVIWTVEISSTDYFSRAADFEEHFLNVAVDGETTSMEVIQRCFFEAELLFNPVSEEFTRASITRSGVKHRRRRDQARSK